MKKIITAVAAVAMAASMFAVDFSAQAKSSVDLFNMTFKEGENPTLFKTGNGANCDDTKIVATMNGDKCGATFRLRGTNIKVPGEAHTKGTLIGCFDDYNLWIAPTDAVKIMWNTGTPGPNQETFTWWEYNVGKPTTSLNVDIKPVDGLTITFGVNAEPWIVVNNSINDTALKVAYSADFGNVYAMAFAQTSFNDFTFVAGYKNKFDALDIFADASLKIASTKLDSMKADVNVSFSQDAFTATVYSLYTCDFANVANKVALLAKVSYKLDAFTPYVDFRCGDLLKGNSTLELGADFKVGAASMNAALKFGVSNPASISVPVSATVSL